MEIQSEHKSQEEREKLVFRLLLLNKWFLIPTSVAYEWLLSTSFFGEAVYSFIKPTIFYTAASLILIVLLWFSFTRYAEKSTVRRYYRQIVSLSLLSFILDFTFVFFLAFLPTVAGNILWFLFLPPLSIVVVVPRMKSFPHLIVDSTATVVVFIAIIGLLSSFESPTSPPHFIPCDMLLCLSGLLFNFVTLRMVRSWIYSVNHETEVAVSWHNLWKESLQRFPTDFFMMNDQGDVLISSKGIRKLFPIPEAGHRDWPEETQPIRNAILLRFHAEKEIDKTITVPDDTRKVPLKIFPTFFGFKEERYCIALVQEENPEIGAPMGIVRSDRLTIAGQIAAGLAHELGNPLGVIQSCASYLHQKSSEDDSNREEYELIAKESKRCHNLIERLLSLASPKRDTPAVHDLRDILDHSISLVKYQAGSREIELTKFNQPALIYVNEGQLSAVFINLFLNALQSMETSPPEAKLRVHMRTRGKEAIVDVTDEGVGITAEELEKVFDPFFTKRAEGTGLGLSLVHQIVTSIGGRIDVASTPGAGTTFTVYLPLYEEPEGE